MPRLGPNSEARVLSPPIVIRRTEADFNAAEELVDDTAAPARGIDASVLIELLRIEAGLPRLSPETAGKRRTRLVVPVRRESAGAFCDSPEAALCGTVGLIV